MKLRFSLFTRILLWFFLNLIVIGAVLFLLFHMLSRVSPEASPFEPAGRRLGIVAQSITAEMTETASREERDQLLQRYSDLYQVEFQLFDNAGEQLGGPNRPLPAEVLKELTMPAPHKGPRQRPIGGPPGGRGPIFGMKTDAPARYWMGIRIPVIEKGSSQPIRATLILSSESRFGRGLFFDPKPLLLIAAIVFGLSILLWTPFVRGLTRTIKQMTAAAEQIAEEKFDVRVDVHRSDELGRLGTAINHLSERLDGFVKGQKRFLGDISHELNSPLARMQFALGILEERSDPNLQKHIADVQEEIDLMSKLVSELLAYARAGLQTTEVRLEKTALRPLIEQVHKREAEGHDVHVDIDESLSAMAQPDLLARALANVVRNAVRYAAAGGPITIAARPQGDHILLTVSDRGPGVPDEALPKLFDPFYRLESDRARNTGGTGLGLAIARTCIEACRGTIEARNLHPGLEIRILLCV
jgi:two-component system sensor histidine kinase CpxA